ncbi:MAG: hypothetical protein QOH93_1247 [Chloroflexia bacterium]|jgi:hypothetical protein|nr:hypothetical protein [Chloroflexia bacterium]
MPGGLTDERLAQYQQRYAERYLRGRCSIERRKLNTKSNTRNGPYEEIATDVPCSIAASSQRSGMNGDPFVTSFARGSGATTSKRRLSEFAAWADLQAGDRIRLAGGYSQVNEIVMPDTDDTYALSILADVERAPDPETAEIAVP